MFVITDAVRKFVFVVTNEDLLLTVCNSRGRFGSCCFSAVRFRSFGPAFIAAVRGMVVVVCVTDIGVLDIPSYRRRFGSYHVLF